MMYLGVGVIRVLRSKQGEKGRNKAGEVGAGSRRTREKKGQRL